VITDCSAVTDGHNRGSVSGVGASLRVITGCVHVAYAWSSASLRRS